MIRFCFLTMVFLSSCLQPEAEAPLEGQALAQGEAPQDLTEESMELSSQGTGTSEVEGALEEDLFGELETEPEDLTKEPFEATAFLNPQVTLGDAGIFEGVQVPSLQLQYGTADFVQVARCVQSYEFKNHFGEDVSTLDDSVASLEEKKTMWFNALRANRSCKMLSYKTTTQTLQDYTAPSGTFYYILNPCLTASTSVTKQEDCSYNLQFSGVVTYEEQIREQLHDKAIELSSLEQTIHALMTEGQILAQLLESKIRACENTIAIETAQKKQLAGLLDATLYVVSFAAIVLVTGDVGNATMLAELVVGIGSNMFLKKAFRLGEIPNSCLDMGKYTAYDPFTGLQTEAALRQARRYEALYGVVETYNRLEQIFVDTDLLYSDDYDEGDGGELEVALKQYQALLYEVAQQDSSVISLEDLYRKQ